MCWLRCRDITRSSTCLAASAAMAGWCSNPCGGVSALARASEIRELRSEFCIDPLCLLSVSGAILGLRTFSCYSAGRRCQGIRVGLNTGELFPRTRWCSLCALCRQSRSKTLSGSDDPVTLQVGDFYPWLAKFTCRILLCLRFGIAVIVSTSTSRARRDASLVFPLSGRSVASIHISSG